MRALLLLGLLAGCGGGTPEEVPEAAPPRRPNVLFLVWDTVRADMLGLYGHERDTTPHLSRWAARGVVWERGLSPGVWTLPAHASLFTGLPVTEHGVGDARKHLDGRFLTLAEILRDAGWDTFAWSSNPFVSRKTNLLQGFDAVAHPWVAPWSGPSKRVQARKRVDEASVRAQDDGPWHLGNVGEVSTRALGRWLDDRGETDRPWFAFVNLMEAHTLRSPTLAARRRVMDEPLVQRSLEVDQRNPRLLAVNAGVHAYDETDLEVIRRIYEACLLEVDRVTHELLTSLRERGALDDTIVVLVSDHGELLGEHDLFGHQLGVWSILARVPMVAVWPGRLPAKRVSEPTSTAELFGMLLGWTGVPVPAEAARGVDWARRTHGVVTEYTEPMTSTMKAMRKMNPKRDFAEFEQGWVAIERPGWRLMRGDLGVGGLYDVVGDPRELAAVEDAEREAALEAALGAWRGTVVPFDHASAEAYGGGIDGDEEVAGGLRALGYVE